MLPTAIERLATLGYGHRGNLGIPEREAFFAPANDPPLGDSLAKALKERGPVRVVVQNDNGIRHG